MPYALLGDGQARDRGLPALLEAAGEVEEAAVLLDAGERGVGVGGVVLQVGDDAAVDIEAQGERMARRTGLEEAGQAEDDGAQERARQERVEERDAREGEGEPEAIA